MFFTFALMSFPKKLQKKLEDRKAANALRKLGTPTICIDFTSNDYLGFSKNENIYANTHALLNEHNCKQNGASGSRLLSGNHPLYPIVEGVLCNFHQSESALIFNSGYDANVGFFSSVPQRGDVILYDEYAHASVRDGVAMSHAKAYKFRHNDLRHLDEMLMRLEPHDIVYVVTESVFSMDGDSPDLRALAGLCKKYSALLVVDEAHAIGVLGKQGLGLIQDLNQESLVFARIVTFGKALGCHGAAILGSKSLKLYLVNFSRSFIYTTALPPHSLATIKCAYDQLVISANSEPSHNAIWLLNRSIQLFKAGILENKLQSIFIDSNSAIQCCIIPGNERVKSIATKLQELGFNVMPILSPTVPENHERLRFCLHSYNTQHEISEVLKELATFVSPISVLA